MTSAALLLGAALATISSQNLLEPAIRWENRVGVLPPSTGVRGVFFLTQVIPSLALHSTNTTRDLQARISSRLLLREPNPSGSYQVLARHTLELNHYTQHSHRWTTRMDIRGSYGEDDYTTIRDTLSAGSRVSPSEGIPSPTGGTTSGTFQQNTNTQAALSMQSIGATFGSVYHLSRISSTSLRLETLYRDTRNASAGEQTTVSSFGQQWNSSADLSYSKALSRSLRIETSLRESYLHVVGQSETLLTQSTVGLGKRISPDTAMTLNGGATYVTYLSAPLGRQSPGLLPTVNISWNGTLINERGRQLRAIATSGYLWMSDPLTGVGTTRVPVTLHFDSLLENRLGIVASVSYITTVSQTTSSGTSGGLTNGTTFSASLPVTYRWNEQFTFESGVRMSLRGPRMAGPSELSELELWGYFAITATTRYRLN